MNQEFIRENFKPAKQLRGKLEWRFEPMKRKSWYYKLVFDPQKRMYVALFVDWNDRRRGSDRRISVKTMPADDVAVLRSCLPDEAVAICTMAGLEAARSAG